jgi:toxin ParE1/3/4
MSFKPYEVLLTAGAERDLTDLHQYVSEFDSPGKADALLDKLMTALDSLHTVPERGSYPRELATLGIREYRQILYKPYRIIYRIAEQKVYVFLIVDGRRDMQALLARRLLAH